jgi:hypothetical protein
MRKPLYIYFRDKLEYIIKDGKTEEKPIGALLFAFLDLDIICLQSEAEALKNGLIKEFSNMEYTQYPKNVSDRNYFRVAKFYQKTREFLNRAHPTLAEALDRQLENAIEIIYAHDLPLASDFAYRIFKFYPSEYMPREFLYDWLYNEDLPCTDAPLIRLAVDFVKMFCEKIRELAALQADLPEMLKFALEYKKDGEPLERYCEMQAADFPPYERQKEVYQHIGAQYILTKNAEGEKPAALPYYSSLDIRALIMLEFEHMALNNYYVRKCANCGGFFRPYSAAGVYCERIYGETGKTCKAVAPKLNKEARMSEHGRIYQKYSNKYQMWYERQRRKKMTAAELAAWREAAKKLRFAAEEADMPPAEFERQIDVEGVGLQNWLEKFGNK